MSTPAPDVQADTPPPNGKRRVLLIGLAALFTIAAIVWFLVWLLVLRFRETTDDAYVAGDQVAVVSLAPGIITEVAADDTQRVAAAQSDALVMSQEVDLARAEADLAQRQPLLQSQAVAGEEVRHAQSAVDAARAALSATRRSAESAHLAIAGSDYAHQPAVLQARAAYQQAWLARHRTDIVAPISGQVALRSAQIGARVMPGQALMSLVALDKLWVDANFKEAQLGDLRIGQAVRVTTDLYGSDFRFHGKVVGMAAGTGSAFSLLPAQNASGNWIKVVQRVPVRIALDPEELRTHPLRIGLSVTAVTDIHDKDGPVLATEPSPTASATTSVYASEMTDAAAAADAVIRTELGTAR
jgi:membrane fusion protein (multidrug efflux system)